jgi:hypothetical protein
MKRLEQDPEEIQQMEDALARQATPTHGEFGESMARPLQAFGRLVLRDPVEHGWELIPDNIVLGEE